MSSTTCLPSSNITMPSQQSLQTTRPTFDSNNIITFPYHVVVPPKKSHSSLPTTTTHNDDDCAICLTPLQSHATVQLECGHTWHLHCIREQIMRSQPMLSKQLSFSGIRCPLCLRICRHPLVDKLVAPCEALLKTVARLALEQATLDQSSVLPSSNGNQGHQCDVVDSQQQCRKMATTTNVVDQTLVDSYTFYMCAKCQQPYIAGISDCLDQYQNNNNNKTNSINNHNNGKSIINDINNNNDNNNNDNDSMYSAISHFCSACLLTSPANPFSTAKPLEQLCLSPRTHSSAFVWKCRFCCHPASVICHDHTHICKSCYDRDTAVRNGVALKFPPKRCKGRSVCTNMHMCHNESVHRNGPTIDCELLLYCAICSSLPKHKGSMKQSKQDSRQNSTLKDEQQGVVVEEARERRQRLGGQRKVNDQTQGVRINNNVSRNTHSVSEAVVKSPNMLFNPCGAEGMDGWICPYHADTTSPTQGNNRQLNSSTVTSPSSSFSVSEQYQKESSIQKNLIGQLSSSSKKLGQWTVETTETSSIIDDGDSIVSTNFVMSSQHACMAQCVDIANFIPSRYSSAITRIEVALQSQGYVSTSSVKLIAAVYDSRMNEISSFKSPAFDTPTDHWQCISHSFTLSRSSRPRFVVLAVMGEQRHHQKEHKRFTWNRQVPRHGIIKVKHCAVHVLYRNNHRRLFYRNAFDRVSLQLIGPKQPIVQLLIDTKEEEDGKEVQKKEKEKLLHTVRRGVQPEHLATNTLPSTKPPQQQPQLEQDQQPQLPIVEHEEFAEHHFHQRSFSRVSSASLSLRSVETATSASSCVSNAEKDRHFLRRGRLSRSFYRCRYRQYD